MTWNNSAKQIKGTIMATIKFSKNVMLVRIEDVSPVRVKYYTLTELVNNAQTAHRPHVFFRNSADDSVSEGGVDFDSMQPGEYWIITCAQEEDVWRWLKAVRFLEEQIVKLV
jgi:hypothetical protein